MNDEDQFEIIDSGHTRHRWSRADGYLWQFGLKPGTDDPDHSIIEVLWETKDGDLVTLIAFLNPISVGDVSPYDCLNMPERQIERCPQCGYGRAAG